MSDNQNTLSVHTAVEVVGVGSLEIGASPPQLASSSTSSTTTTEPSPSTTEPSLTTPKNQAPMTKEMREKFAKQFVTDLGLSWDDIGKDPRSRARRVMTEDYSWSPNKVSSGKKDHYKTSFGDEFFKFRNTGQPWTDLSRVFFDENAIEKYLVIRKQRAGICCLHASVVLQHYLQCLRTGTYDHKMLDISEFLREKLDPEKQRQYIQKGTCGLGSENFFCTITGLELSELQVVEPYPKCKNQNLFQTGVDHLVKLYNLLGAPALVSCFYIEGGFSDGICFDYEVEDKKFKDYAVSQGKPKGSRIQHSMVLLGLYIDKTTGKVWLLLQNFWQGKYFRVVSAEYLASCRGRVCFVPDDVDSSLQVDISTVDAHYVETAVEFEECLPKIQEED